ncbi:ribosome small subunit-dependent GTPase A [Persicobacter sp. CCB-QB2]|uniref:ribosome small subunit-dependent GTPase A n=1 Tax=Persicobacter sp. CCB-QB2 TaxID=1561025 RepID=UPI0006A99437|nr:ribosome small subunit-dependent GTPase A [Persicobacter sp. CCB-QB2]
MIKTLKEWGFPQAYQNIFPHFIPARIIRAHRQKYEVASSAGLFQADLAGKLMFLADDPSELPQVGDWVAIQPLDDTHAYIMERYERRAVLSRAKVGGFGSEQVLAAHVDLAIIVQSMDQNYNLNRLERYLVQIRACEIQPAILLTKSDLCTPEELAQKLQEVQQIAGEARVLQYSLFQEDLNPILDLWPAGQTAVVVGSSGVGKSSLVNRLLGQEIMETSAISHSNQKGRHTTSHRELVQLVNGAFLIDTPGTREFGLSQSGEALEMTFEEIAELADSCKFRGCSHQHEPGCAVQEALEDGRLEWRRWESYQKLQREQEHFAMDKVNRRKKDKALGKMYRAIQGESRKRKGRS